MQINLKNNRSKWNVRFSQLNWLLRLDAYGIPAEAPYIWMEDAMVMDSIGADYLLLQVAWDAKHSGPPELMEQLFHLFDAPNRFGLPTFYTSRVWAWKENPSGTFVNWHPNVSCEAFADRFGEELGNGHTPPCRIHRTKGTKSKDNPVGYRFLSLIKGEPS